MNTLRSALVLGALIAAGAAPARAECHFDPYEFFPDRNDHVQITAHTEANHGCGMGFQEEPRPSRRRPSAARRSPAPPPWS